MRPLLVSPQSSPFAQGADRFTLVERKLGPLLASGRDADIFEYGSDFVLRRSRSGRPIGHEARIMEYVREAGYPVPAVDSVSDDGTEIVMERVRGVDLVTDIGRKPWALRHHAGVLAELHLRLHRIEPPDWLRIAPLGHGDCLVHLDLHPLNVIMGTDGPMVIDWANAARGDPATDVALCWVLSHAGDVPGTGLKVRLMKQGRRIFVQSFLKPFDRDPLRAVLAEAVQYKAADPHITEAEIGRMVDLVRSETGS
jgi:aminoglycoside phosphotransferase (APT) family kinase protein